MALYNEHADTIEEKHNHFIYPVVRMVSVGKKTAVGGSGVCVYSQDGETYFLTNHHVIDNLIDIEEKWNSVAQRPIRIEQRRESIVETFDYENLSTIVEANSKKADVVAWDEQMDLGLVQLRSKHTFPYVAPLITPESADERLRIFTPIYTVGCGLGVPPLVTQGTIGGFDFNIEEYPYMLCTAPAIFGNSGGPVFSQETGEVIGLIARMNVVMVGLGGSPITHMTWAIPTKTIKKFLENHMYEFILDPSIDRAECHRRREELRDKARKAQLTGPTTEDEKASALADYVAA